MKIEKLTFADGGSIPNSRLPVLLYRGALSPARTSPEALEAMFAENGWPPAWRAQIFAFHHYHSNCHEALGIARGEAKVMFGGPAGRPFDIRAGDVVVIPAGVGHKRLSSSAEFLVVGAYPPGVARDLLRGEPGERPEADVSISKVPLPLTDPVEGISGSLTKIWR